METWILALIPIYITHILFLGIFMFFKRINAVRSKEVSVKYFKAYDIEAPTQHKVYQNHFSNQFEVPILFFITCLTVVVLGKASPVFFWLGCAFIASRVLHSYIHLGSNHVLKRAGAFFSGVFIVLAMWVYILLA